MVLPAPSFFFFPAAGRVASRRVRASQVKFYAFFGMIGNVPLVPLTKMLNDKFGDDQQVNDRRPSKRRREDMYLLYNSSSSITFRSFKVVSYILTSMYVACLCQQGPPLCLGGATNALVRTCTKSACSHVPGKHTNVFENVKMYRIYYVASFFQRP